MALPLPALDLNASLAPFAVVAIAMVAITVLVLGLVRPRDGRPPLVTQALLTLAVIGGGSVLLLALLFVFLDPNGTVAWTWVLLAFNFMMTVPVGLWFVGHLIFRDRRVAEQGWTWPASIGVAVTGSEVLMGLLFAVGAAPGPLGPGRALAFGLSSAWFFWSMAGIMAALVLWAPLSRLARAGGRALVLVAIVAPWVAPYPLLGGLATTAVMGGAFFVLVRELARGSPAGDEAGLLLGLGAAFLAMALAGLAVAVSGGSDLGVIAFGATMGLVMVAEVSYLLRRTYLARPVGAVARPPVASPSVPDLGTTPPGPVGGP